MYEAITQDIRVSVETFYQEKSSNPVKSHYVFAYKIEIHNHSDFTIQLLERHWIITDSLIGQSEVKGEGVVGLKPIIEPGTMHSYVSGCHLESQFGKMRGTYTMQKLKNGSLFKVEIPEFILVVPSLFN
jgi:ApaG protein